MWAITIAHKLGQKTPITCPRAMFVRNSHINYKVIAYIAHSKFPVRFVRFVRFRPKSRPPDSPPGEGPRVMAHGNGGATNNFFLIFIF